MASAAHTPASSGTTAALGDVKIAFSEEGDYLAILYSLGESIVKVYSADDAAAIVTKLDSLSIEEQQKHQGDPSLNATMNGVPNSSSSLIGSFCSFVWESFSGRGGSRRRRRTPRKLGVSNTAEELSTVSAIAIGTNGGRFFVWEAMNGSKIRWKRQINEDGSACQPVSYNSKTESYFVGGSGITVHQVHAISGQVLQSISCSISGKKRLSALAISADGDQVGAATSRIGIYSVDSSDQACKLAGHQNGTKQFQFLGPKNFAISIGNNERTIAIWRIESKSRKQLSSHRTISLDFPVESVASNDNHVVAICSNFQAFYFKLSDDGEQLQDPVPIPCNDKVLAAVVSSGTAILATGAAASPSFERVSLDQIPAQDDANGSASKKERKPRTRKRKSPEGSEQATVVGPDDIAGDFLPAVATKRSDKSTSKADKSHQEEDKADEQTMGERLDAIRADSSQEGGKEEDDTQALTASNVTASSLAVLLSQALQADDKNLLEKCLNVTNAKTVKQSVQNLRTPQVLKFLQHSISRLRSSPARAVQLSIWNKEILSQHTGSLMANPKSQKLLADLHQVIDSRGKLFAPLLSLGGRLELLKSQIDRKKKVGVDSTSEQGPGKTLVVAADGGQLQDADPASSDSDGQGSGEEEEEEEEADDMEFEESEGGEGLNGLGNGSIDADMESADDID